MAEHTRLARFTTRVREARAASAMRREVAQEQRFERQKMQLERTAELEERRARVRKAEATSRPVGRSRAERFGGSLQSFATGFAQRQQPRAAPEPRVAATRRAKKGRKRPARRQQSLLEPTFRFGGM